MRDTATSEPMATDLHMRIGRVTKTVVTTAILQLVDQGKVGLDDPISRYVPGVPNGDAVTLRHRAARSKCVATGISLGFGCDNLRRAIRSGKRLCRRPPKER